MRIVRSRRGLLPVLLLAVVCSGGCDAGDGINITEADLLGVLRKWRDQILPTLSQEERQKVEAFVATYPLTAPAGTESIALQLSQDAVPQISPVINRRDWAYAVQGVGYTVVGGVGKDQASLLDVGFWCFLEAALLQPREIEHLGNVGFHLNDRQAYDDAQTVLLYARSLDSGYVPVRNNLAHTYSRLGDHDAAITEAQYVIALEPGLPVYHQRLAKYFQDAGHTDAAQAIQSALQGVSDLPSFPVGALPPNLSSQGEQVRTQIKALGDKMQQSGTEILGRYNPQLQAAASQFLAQWAQITQEALFDCPWRVGQAGGDAYAICVNCYLPGAPKAYDAGLTFYTSAIITISGFEHEAFSALAGFTQQGRDLVRQAGLSTTEGPILLGEVHREIFTANSSKILGPRAELNWRWDLTVEDYRAAMAEGCGDAPVGDIPVVEEESISCKFMPFMCKKWTIWFAYGSLQYNPDGTFGLSVGQGASIKLEYNFDTGHAGYGVGLGLNLGPVGEAGATLMFRSKTGVEADIGIGLRQPLPVAVLPGTGLPKLAQIKYGGLEN